MLGIFWSLLPIIFFALASGYFSLMEVSIIESRHAKLEKIAPNEKILEKVSKFLDEPAKPVAVSKIGSTVSGILSGFFIIPLSNGIYDIINFFDQALVTSIIVSVIFIASVIILFGEFFPARLAQQNPEEILINNQKTFRLITNLMSPIVNFCSGISGGVMTLFGMNAETSDAVTEDEVKDLIEQGTEDGTFAESEREMVDKIFHMSDQTAYSLMTPRVHMVWLDLSDSLEQSLKIVRENRQNIFPVGEGSLDAFRGVIYAKDLLNAALDKNINLQSLIKKPMFVPRTMETFRLVEKFKTGGDSVAIVNDEYGGVVGFITPEDAELPKNRQFLLQSDNSWIVDGLCDIDEFKRQFNFETLPDEERDHFKTMGGFVTSRFGYIPKIGETVTWNNLKFKVLEMDRARIAKIAIRRV